ncbi:unnamed protein product [Fraxinus pennsylvanica]|uniref:RNase H type-1 domain-containing protein n=1 Tax=Fraxinus pennsylvanica TaxID=56036 RepID=A0AAD2ABB4_9LAMI|nr:unnamed protein product [Fraxinus pennsylvanica]
MQGWYKLNTDGCCLGNPGICGAGGNIRNEKGDIVIAFTEYLGEGTNNGAELVLLYGLRRTKRMGINRLEVELDSLIIVNWLKRKVCGIRYLEDYWEEIQYLLSIISCRVQHIHREGNSVADILSKLGASSVSYIWMDSIAIPSSVRGALRMDKLDIPNLRGSSPHSLTLNFPMQLSQGFFLAAVGVTTSPRTGLSVTTSTMGETSTGPVALAIVFKQGRSFLEVVRHSVDGEIMASPPLQLRRPELIEGELGLYLHGCRG